MFYVLSFDPKRIEVSTTSNKRMIVKKKTTRKEYNNIIRAREHILKHQPTLFSDEYEELWIRVAEIYEWNQNEQILSTLFCQGRNLEEIFRETIGKNRDGLICLIRKIFEIFKSNGFLWGDFAPRNMIWDQSQKIIWLVDFERDLHLRDCPVDRHLFNRYVRNYSREEFSCFLIQHERAFLFDSFLDEAMSGFIPVIQIKSRRKCTLLNTMFGEKECYSLNEIRQIEDIMASVATPFQVNNIFYFPMDALDFIGSKGGPNEYVKAVMAIYKLGEFDSFSELKKRTKTF